jgi:5-methylcytosine-specific restriction endonuclease McrA
MVESIIWRTSVFVRDQYTCMECGVRSGMGKKIILHAHHIKPLASILRENSIKTPEEAISCLELWDTSNGVTLCKGCHAKTDSYMGKYNKNYVN